MIIYAIIPARSGSKGLIDKNIKNLAGMPLISYSINFAKALGCHRIICSTDSEHYAQIARNYGAEVPFLRSELASSDKAMEQDILLDLAKSFSKECITQPDIIVWLRPTFVFRDIDAVKKCIDILCNDNHYSSARTVCETEARLYTLSNNLLEPTFKDNGKSMIRRQDIGVHYKVFSTDVIRFNPENINDDFLGRNVYGVPINKFCGLDIDDESDFRLVEAVIKHDKSLVEKYLYL